jgi:hypothetical protein
MVGGAKENKSWMEKGKSWLEKDGVNGTLSGHFDSGLLKAAVTPADMALDFGRGLAGSLLGIDDPEGDSMAQDAGDLLAKVIKGIGFGDVEVASAAEANLTSLFKPGLKGKSLPDEKDKPKTGKKSKDPSSFSPGAAPAGGGGAPGAGGAAMAGAGPAVPPRHHAPAPAPAGRRPGVI